MTKPLLYNVYYCPNLQKYVIAEIRTIKNRSHLATQVFARLEPIAQSISWWQMRENYPNALSYSEYKLAYIQAYGSASLGKKI